MRKSAAFALAIFLIIIIVIGYSYITTGSLFEGIGNLFMKMASSPLESLSIFLIGMFIGIAIGTPSY